MYQSIVSDNSQPIELYLACRNLTNKDIFSKSDPQIWVYIKQNNKWVLQGKTEIIDDNLNPNFSKTFILDYYFEAHQYMKFEVVDIDSKNSYDYIGSAETYLCKVVGSKNQIQILDLKCKQGKPSGKLILRVENAGKSNEEYFMQWKGIKLMNTDQSFFALRWFDKSDPLLRFYKKIDDGTSQGNWLKVHETEHIMDNLNPLWNSFVISGDKLISGDYKKPIKIECWDWEKHGEYQFIGEFMLTLSDIIEKEKRKYDLYNPKLKRNTGILELLKFERLEKFSFIDYLKGGVQLNVIVAIDFTGSNGIPTSPESLHAIHPSGILNQYQQAITNVCDILLNYDYDKMVPLYGFGAKTRFPTLTSNQVLHCFPLTGNAQNSEVYQLNGIMECYKNALRFLEFSGPTYFAPIFNEAKKVAQYHKTQNSGVYSVLLVITDGEIHDMETAIDSLFEMALLPISIIIIGVGNEDFANMRTLDGDNGLYNSKGQKIIRDLVQFVPYKKFMTSINDLAKEVLAEIPEQLVTYMKVNGIKPNPPEKMDISKLVPRTQDIIIDNQSLLIGNQSVKGVIYANPMINTQLIPQQPLQVPILNQGSGPISPPQLGYSNVYPPSPQYVASPNNYQSQNFNQKQPDGLTQTDSDYYSLTNENTQESAKIKINFDN